MATMKVEATVHGVRPPPRHALVPMVAALVPGSNELVLGGPASLLQFHDPLHDRYLDKLQARTLCLRATHIIYLGLHKRQENN